MQQCRRHHALTHARLMLCASCTSHRAAPSTVSKQRATVRRIPRRQCHRLPESAPTWKVSRLAPSSHERPKRATTTAWHATAPSRGALTDWPSKPEKQKQARTRQTSEMITKATFMHRTPPRVN
ncbi:hypothetical protein BU26DRAFT_189495 [Trematosphaeria pertusa]|uniref:Uncharacterized protein n=1 Tax=Trematosphaeria pertusa TaxID=390896 RepID=A0A6A6HTC1_9PLEO|nr:uncharacterized protein BU26DRAFT_189495 [Trematosphaeria pertusa]KAF2240773.1 hypothetical protein BU26DRAFT_189495 [Trematosphaeria pertusa]